MIFQHFLEGRLAAQEAEVKLIASAKAFEMEMRELKLRLADEEMKLTLG